ncbi:MAG: YraN family protein [bacterium]|nr:YraN family protein [bacterium]
MNPTIPPKLLGKQGEDIAVTYLKNHGYRIIERNFRKRYGELDIICLRKYTLVSVEVKTRIDTRYGSPEEAITPRKLRELIRMTQFYSMLHPNLPELLRIDLIAIQLDSFGVVLTLRHIENITELVAQTA